MSPVETFNGTDRFRVVGRLGAGGMGIVYEAIDRDSGQRVALKRLKQIDPTAVYRFKQEFRSLADLSHPNLIPLYELISDGEQWLLVMELVEDAVDFLAYLREDDSPKTVLPKPPRLEVTVALERISALDGTETTQSDASEPADAS